MQGRHLLALLAFVMAVMFGYWMATTAVPSDAGERKVKVAANEPRRTAMEDEEMPKFRRGERLPSLRGDWEATIAGAMEGQRVLVFKDQDGLRRFLAAMGDRVRLLGRLDPLNALRVGFGDYADLQALLDGSEQSSFIFPVNAPPPKQGTVQSSAVPIGSGLLEWLGITGQHPDAGKGVFVAILDTGVSANSAFNTTIRSINLVDLPSDPTAQNGHGTAVASMIIGNTELTPGVAPAADILSVRIANDNGESDSFRLAEGIIAAVDAHVSMINISMGSEGDSVIVRNALQYAFDRGVLVVAAPGNNGSDQVSYPGANAGVITPAAVDDVGNHLDFSNSGPSIDLAAPGYSLNAAWTGDQAMVMTGTSFSAPIVVGAIAYVMTEVPGNLTAAQAYQRILTVLNDGGAAGKDQQLGGGMLDLGRVMAGNTPGIYDAALASTALIPADAGNPYGQVEILVQNRGTSMLTNTSVRVSAGSGVVTSNITSLVPNAVQTVHVPISQPADTYANGLRVEAQVLLGGGLKDAKPSNDHRVETYVPAGSK